MTLPDRWQNRRGTSTLWTSTNPVLLEGELGYETDTRRRKYGDGVTAWTSLPYAAGVVLSDSLTAVGALTPAADRYVYFTSSTAAALGVATVFGRSILADADAAAGRVTLALGTAAVLNSGTSGGTVALCNGANTWSSTQTFASATVSGTLVAGATSALSPLSLGGSSITPKVQSQGTTIANSGSMAFVSTNTATSAPYFVLARERTSSGAVQNSDRLGVLAFSGGDGSSLRLGAALVGEAYANFTSGNAYGRIKVVIANGSAEAGEAFRWDPLGNYSNHNLAPLTDNTRSLGGSANRWTEVYAANNVINTSDAREKQDIGPIGDDLLDAWAGVEWRTFRWIEAVEEKGDGARWHFGLIAQQVRDVIDAALGEGAAVRLGLVCHDAWGARAAETTPETEAVPTIEYYDDIVAVGRPRKDGSRRMRVVPRQRTVMVERPTGQTIITRPAGPAADRWGLRYDQCFAVNAAYQDRRLSRIEAMLAARLP